MSGPETLPVLPPNAPIDALTSLKFKANQIIESIHILQRTLDAHPGLMPAWPDILNTYNLLFSQMHSFSASLSGTAAQARSAAVTNLNLTRKQNPLENLIMHPSTAMPDAQLDSEVIPLLRNQQTTDVLRMENTTVRRLAERMNTRGSLGVLGLATPAPIGGPRGRAVKPEYTDVLAECAEIRSAHDARVDRAVKAVTMLRERYTEHELYKRHEVELEEPEELTWPQPQEQATASTGIEGLPGGDSGSASEDEGDEDMVERGEPVLPDTDEEEDEEEEDEPAHTPVEVQQTDQGLFAFAVPDGLVMGAEEGGAIMDVSMPMDEDF